MFTKEQIHAKAKQTGLKGWALGCSCEECNTEFEEALNKVERQAMKDDNLSDVQDYCPRCDKYHEGFDCSVGIIKEQRQDISCEICDTPKVDPKAIWRCLNCGGKLYVNGISKILADKINKDYDNVYAKEIWNEAIEAAAKIPYLFSYELSAEIRKLKK